MSKKYYTQYLPKPGGHSRVVKSNGIPVGTEIEIELCICYPKDQIYVGDEVVYQSPHVRNHFTDEIVDEIDNNTVWLESGSNSAFLHIHKKMGVIRQDMRDLFKEGQTINHNELELKALIN